MKRVCYVIPTLRVGGTEKQLVHIMKGLIHDHEVTVICTEQDGGLAADARRLGADVRVLGTWTGWDPRMKRRLARNFRRHRPDIVHTFMFGFDFYANRAARETGVPVLISSRRQLATWKKRRHIRWQRKANRLVDCIVANSQAVARFAIEQEGADPALFRVLPNGIDADAFVCATDPGALRLRYRIPFHTHVIGTVANFSPVKDHELFVAVAEELARRRADVHFLMVGTGPLWRSVERLLVNRKLEARFTRVATIQEMADLYALMATSVLCSKMEGFPNAVIESMAAGTPVVAAAVGGVPELVEDRVRGRLVHSRDPKDFADAIESVLDNPAESKAMADRAAGYVRGRLTMEKMVTGYRQLYAELLAKRIRRGV